MRIIDSIGHFKLAQTARGYIAINEQGGYENHAHFDSESGARQCLELIRKGLLPKSEYFKKAARRLIGDEGYCDLIDCKKQRYININKGAVRK